MATHSSQDDPSVIAPAPVVLGLVLFVVTLGLVPALWTLFVPVHVSAVGQLLWVVGSTLGAAVIVGRGDRSDHPGATLLTALLGFLVVVVFVASPFLVLEGLFSHIAHVETDLFPSPSGRLVAVVESSDVGAFAPIESDLYVRGRLVPGLLEWRYFVDSDDIPSPRWIDNDQLDVDGRTVRIPAVIRWLAW